MNRNYARIAAALAVIVAFGGCISDNLFSIVDAPSGDAQLISAARAALDRGDFNQAIEYYQQVTDMPDITRSETAFALLGESGAGMGAFANAFGDGSNVDLGKAITQLADAIGISGSAGENARVLILEAYQIGMTVPADSTGSTALSSLVEFLSATALAAETLAEGTAALGNLQPTDIATGGATCTATNLGVCTQPTSPGLPSGTTGNISDLGSATAAELENSSNAPTLELVRLSIVAASTAIHAVAPNSSIDNGIGSLSSALTSLTLPADDAAFRAGLIAEGVGTY